MSTPPYFLVVIPCYNEYNRLDTLKYSESLRKNDNISILFVDDGSKDLTAEKFKLLKGEFPNRVDFLLKSKNEGKATAVYDGMRRAIAHKKYDYLGYIDADLAVSIDEIVDLANVLTKERKEFIFGSRWKRIGSKIKRKLIRHYVGRVFATIASLLLGLDVYDTQCGAKVFTRSTAEKVFNQKFNVNWSFDVEIFFRLLNIYPKHQFDKYCLEHPLKSWKDVDGSKVKLSHTINVLRDFWTLKKIYR